MNLALILRYVNSDRSFAKITISDSGTKLKVKIYERQLQGPSKLNLKVNKWHKYIDYAVIGPKVSAILGIGFCIGLKTKIVVAYYQL